MEAEEKGPPQQRADHKLWDSNSYYGVECPLGGF